MARKILKIINYIILNSIACMFLQIFIIFYFRGRYDITNFCSMLPLIYPIMLVIPFEMLFDQKGFDLKEYKKFFKIDMYIKISFVFLSLIILAYEMHECIFIIVAVLNIFATVILGVYEVKFKRFVLLNYDYSKSDNQKIKNLKND